MREEMSHILLDDERVGLKTGGRAGTSKKDKGVAGNRVVTVNGKRGMYRAGRGGIVKFVPLTASQSRKANARSGQVKATRKATDKERVKAGGNKIATSQAFARARKTIARVESKIVKSLKKGTKKAAKGRAKKTARRKKSR